MSYVERWSPDALWKIAAPSILPAPQRPQGGGRRRVDDRAVLAAICYMAHRWSTGNRKTGIEPGDRVFFLRQGVEPRGIVGSGTAASRIFPDEQWDDDRAGDDGGRRLGTAGQWMGRAAGHRDEA
ncbi:hypothetical protein [Dactylosporangium sp. NPDC000521]|uniref:hypothetical protein n=1 Tax=Dactylosporangium sp. NPDC000521 TaxID=3363975 RepID=UPI00369B2576